MDTRFSYKQISVKSEQLCRSCSSDREFSGQYHSDAQLGNIIHFSQQAFSLGDVTELMHLELSCKVRKGRREKGYLLRWEKEMEI